MNQGFDAQTLHDTLSRCTADLQAKPGMQAETLRARREFFGDRAALPADQLGIAAEARFAEWYLVERDSELMGEIPLRSLARDGGLGAEVPLEAMLASIAGVFLVEAKNDAAQLRDLQDGNILEMRARNMLEVGVGDVVIGRLYPHDDGHWVPSPAVAVQPSGRALADAFQRDVANLDPGRRLTQAELEHLLFRRSRAVAEAATAVPLEHLEAQLDKILRTGGMSEPTAEELSAAMQAAEGPGQVLGPFLDQVAFDTEIDLEEIRVVLLELWNAHHANKTSTPAAAPQQPAAPASDHEAGLGQRLAERIEEGLAGNEDMEQVFADVAEMLGEDIDEDDDAAREIREHGDLEPLVQEFLWEEDCEDGPERQLLEALLRQQEDAPVPKRDLEYLEPADILRFLLRIYLGMPPESRRERVRDAFAVVERFYRWAERTQHYALEQVLSDCRTDFVDELDRLHGASMELTSSEQGTEGPQATLARVLDVGDGGVELAPCDAGEPTLLVGVGETPQLRAGDLVLGRLRTESPTTVSLEGLVVVLPAAAESLLG